MRYRKGKHAAHRIKQQPYVQRFSGAVEVPHIEFGSLRSQGHLEIPEFLEAGRRLGAEPLALRGRRMLPVEWRSAKTMLPVEWHNAESIFSLRRALKLPGAGVNSLLPVLILPLLDGLRRSVSG